jgi:hypothetical protein
MSSVAVLKPIYRRLSAGDPAPWFHQRSTNNPHLGEGVEAYKA